MATITGNYGNNGIEVVGEGHFLTTNNRRLRLLHWDNKTVNVLKTLVNFIGPTSFNFRGVTYDGNDIWVIGIKTTVPISTSIRQYHYNASLGQTSKIASYNISGDQGVTYRGFCMDRSWMHGVEEGDEALCSPKYFYSIKTGAGIFVRQLHQFAIDAVNGLSIVNTFNLTNMANETGVTFDGCYFWTAEGSGTDASIIIRQYHRSGKLVYSFNIPVELGSERDFTVAITTDGHKLITLSAQ